MAVSAVGNQCRACGFVAGFSRNLRQSAARNAVCQPLVRLANTGHQVVLCRHFHCTYRGATHTKHAKAIGFKRPTRFRRTAFHAKRQLQSAHSARLDRRNRCALRPLSSHPLHQNTVPTSNTPPSKPHYPLSHHPCSTIIRCNTLSFPFSKHFCR